MLPNGRAGRLIYGLIAAAVFAVAAWNLVNGQPHDVPGQSGTWSTPLEFAATVTLAIAVLLVALTVPDRE